MERVIEVLPPDELFRVLMEESPAAIRERGIVVYDMREEEARELLKAQRITEVVLDDPWMLLYLESQSAIWMHASCPYDCDVTLVWQRVLFS